MAIKVLEKGSGDGCNCITTFLCDTEADIINLPTEKSTGVCGECCSAGSLAIIAYPHGTRILNTQGEWK